MFTQSTLLRGPQDPASQILEGDASCAFGRGLGVPREGRPECGVLCRGQWERLPVGWLCACCLSSLPVPAAHWSFRLGPEVPAGPGGPEDGAVVCPCRVPPGSGALMPLPLAPGAGFPGAFWANTRAGRGGSPLQASSGRQSGRCPNTLEPPCLRHGWRKCS